MNIYDQVVHVRNLTENAGAFVAGANTVEVNYDEGAEFVRIGDGVRAVAFQAAWVQDDLPGQVSLAWQTVFENQAVATVAGIFEPQAVEVGVFTEPHDAVIAGITALAEWDVRRHLESAGLITYEEGEDDEVDEVFIV